MSRPSKSQSQTRKRGLKLKTKLILSFTALGLAPAVILSWVGFQRSAEELEKAAGAHLQEAAVAYGETIDRSLYERYGDVPDFADNPLTRGSAEERQVMIDHLMEVHRDYDMMLIADAAGRITTVNSVDGAKNELATGQLVGQSVADTNWFEAVVVDQMPVDSVHYSEAWQSPLVETAYGESRLTLPFSGPIVDETGTTVAVWHSEVSFERVVSDVLSEARHALTEQGLTTIETKVLRSDGVVLDSADRATIGQLNLVTEGQEAALLATGPGGSNGAIVEENVGSGIEQIAGYSVTDGAHSFDGYKWGILFRQDTAEAGAPAAGIRNQLFSIGLLSMVVTTLIGLALARSIVKPLEKNAAQLEKVSEGDLTVEFDHSRADEVGQMSSALSRALHSIGDTLVQVHHSTDSLSQSADHLTDLSRDMSNTASHTSDEADEVANEAERISDASTTVAQAMEEMSSSIREISNNTTMAAQVTSKAVGVSAETRTRMEALDTSATEIGNVVNVITSIADQTDLLALNATIEAHRVGEAGKGFAVVANEVKALAAQTSGATEQIRASVEAIQHDAIMAVQAIAEISELVEQVNEISTTTAGAIEEQSATSAEVSSQIQTVTAGTAKISGSISAVARATSNTNEGANTTLTAANHLSELANDLSRLLSRFELPEQQLELRPAISAQTGTAPPARTNQPTVQPARTVKSKELETIGRGGAITDVADSSSTESPFGLEEDLLEAGWQ